MFSISSLSMVSERPIGHDSLNGLTITKSLGSPGREAHRGVRRRGGVEFKFFGGVIRSGLPAACHDARTHGHQYIALYMGDERAASQ